MGREREIANWGDQICLAQMPSVQVVSIVSWSSFIDCQLDKCVVAQGLLGLVGEYNGSISQINMRKWFQWLGSLPLFLCRVRDYGVFLSCTIFGRLSWKCMPSRVDESKVAIALFPVAHEVIYRTMR